MVGLLESFLAPLAAVVQAEEATIQGAWSTRVRRTYARAAQQGTGEGPFVEVVDARWSGAVRGGVPLAGLAFRMTAEGISWSRSQPPAATPTVEVSLSRSAERAGGAMLAVAFHEAWLPSGPVLCGDPLEGCLVGAGRVMTGRPHLLVAAEGAAFALLLLPAPALKVARNRLWHLREELAAPLPEVVRRLMTRGRSGVLRASDLSERGA